MARHPRSFWATRVAEFDAGWEEAGYHLGRHYGDEVDEHDYDLMQEAFGSDDPGPDIWRRLRAALPGCVALVSEPQRETFLDGFARGFEETR